MNGTLTLKNPVMINGDKITEMKYDTNEMTACFSQLLRQREKRPQV